MSSHRKPVAAVAIREPGDAGRWQLADAADAPAGAGGSGFELTTSASTPRFTDVDTVRADGTLPMVDPARHSVAAALDSRLDGVAATPQAMQTGMPSPASVSLPTDDRFDDQFYLLNTAPGELDLHLFAGPSGTAVWDEYTGAGVHVGIIDDGIDFNHPDLDDNYDASRETVSGFHPSAADAHGTAVAGIIAAEHNGAGTVGIAYDAQITTMAAIGAAASITGVAAFQNALNFDVVNNSWGYTSPWFDQFANPARAAEYTAFDAISLNGRGGLGTVFVKSAGNGRASGVDNADNANFSSLNSSFASVTVAAVDRDGFVSSYSTEGAALLVSAFGTPGQVVTTDRPGAAGYDSGDYTSTFNGTSSAAPMVTGIVALMLQANPALGFRDVSEILATTARHTGTAIGGGISGSEAYAWEWNHGTRWNGQGMHFSEDYGFGLVDALAAVRLAESWTQQNTRLNLVGEDASSSPLDTPLEIPDDNATGVTVGFTMAAGISVEQMQLDLDLTHPYTGDLVMTLTSPSGTTSQLLDRNGGGTDIPDHGSHDITLTSNMFRGEDSGGTWTLAITDREAFDIGTLSAANLRVWGRSGTDDIHVFTEEASDYVTGTPTLTDGNGGIDTLNASAVFSASLIDLRSPLVGSTVIDGRNFAADGSIENAVGGDGDDTLRGTDGANVLRGFRGNDSFVGREGDDLLDGGAGAFDYVTYTSAVTLTLGNGVAVTASEGTDTLIGIEGIIGSEFDDTLDAQGVSGPVHLLGHGGADDVRGAAGSDTLDGGAGVDTLLGGEGADSLLGGDDGDSVQGQDGADTLDGGAGNDTMTGGLGNDTYVVNATGDVTTETSTLVNEIDTVRSSVTRMLGDNLEKLTLTGTLAIDGSGNTLANTLTGNGAANTLNGRAGNDTMTGGLGNDSYVVDATGDVTTETSTLVNEIDTVRSSVTRTLGDNLERLVLTGTLAVDGTGNTLANTLTGNGAANTLNGRAGNDTLDGKLGNDRLSGSAGADVFQFTSALGASNVDRISDFTAADDRFVLDDAVFVGIGPVGQIAALDFRIDAAPGDSSDRVIYDSATGQLLFDADGSGAGSAVLFATVTAGTTISFDDIWIG